MPTARELLEQADALMRRNRSPIPDDIPVLTDSVGAIPPPRALRGRAPPPLPREPEPEPESAEADTIPTLTQMVEEEPPAAKATVVEEGEPSDWLQLGEGEPSAIGEAPDSIAIVPEVAPEQPEPIEESPDEAIEITASSEAEDAFDDEIAARSPVLPAAPVEPPPSASSLAAAYSDTAAPVPDFVLIDEATTSEGDALDDDVPTLIAAEEAAPTLFEAEEAALEGGAPTLLEAGEAAPDDAAPTLLEAEEAAADAPHDAAPAQAVSAADEQARWDAVAEEIRMQVLQRIDLFTDTGLREQLGSRLQPIVDRASADLVATINQHVGELLRAYVAEAIEREIVNWRQNH